MKIVNSKKPLIECNNSQYRIVDIKGTVPKNRDCVISGWHIKNGKIVKRGEIFFIYGKGNFHIKSNIIEND